MTDTQRRARIRHVEVGEGRPLVVLHGLPLDHTCEMPSFEPVFRSRPGWRRIYLDMPGMGGSPPEGWIRSLDDMAEAVGDFIDRVLRDEPFALAGQSFGGYIARGVTHRLSKRMLGLMLWVSASYPRETRHRPPREVLLESPEAMAGFTPEEREHAEAMVVQTTEGSAAIRDLLLPATKRADETFLNEVVARPYTFDPEAVPFSKPALIVCGRQDFWVGYEDQFGLMPHYPRATFAAVDRAGHMLGTSEQNGLFRVLVNDWVDRMEAASP